MNVILKESIEYYHYFDFKSMPLSFYFYDYYYSVCDGVEVYKASA